MAKKKQVTKVPGASSGAEQRGETKESVKSDAPRIVTIGDWEIDPALITSAVKNDDGSVNVITSTGAAYHFTEEQAQPLGEFIAFTSAGAAEVEE